MTNKKILGISAYYHDSAAALIDATDSGTVKILAAAQEERFTRLKHDPAFPTQAIRYCLQQSQISLQALDAIVFYDKPFITFDRLVETYFAFAPRGFLSFTKSMPIWLKEKLLLKGEIRRELSALKDDPKAVLPPLLFSEHHQSHAASAFYPSPFEKAAVLCMDGVGEWATTSAWLGDGNTLEPLWQINFPHSLGLLYSAFTYFCGFKVNSGEYKLMGLAPYGQPLFQDVIKDKLIDIKADGSFKLNLKYFDYCTGDRMTNRAFDQLFGGPAREPESPISERELNLAASIQAVTEEVVLKLANNLKQETGVSNLCLAGGVALNCTANGKLQESGLFDNIWIQPAAGDAGGAVGSAMAAAHNYFQTRRTPHKTDSMQGAYLGPGYNDEAIRHYLDRQQIPYQTLTDSALFSTTAKLISEGNVIGWFQGRMEYGPRALGNRSILGDPRNPQMQLKLNQKIKYRESFRPFAPSILEEKAQQYFAIDHPSPYMLLVAPVQKTLRSKHSELEMAQKNGLEKLYCQRSSLPAITHIDYSARLQTVSTTTNPRYHQLLTAFEELTGCPVLINTSFNVRGEPIVCSPEDAWQCFMHTDMDYLVLGNQLLSKAEQATAPFQQLNPPVFQPD